MGKSVVFLMVQGLGDPVASLRRYRGTSRRHRGAYKAPPSALRRLLETPRRFQGASKGQRCLVNYTEIESVKGTQ